MTDLLGKTIGEYQLIELIHQGQNTIYKGFQPSMNRYVAVKILNPARASDPVFAQQFQGDMQRIAGLEHPNILPTYDYGQEDGLLYIVTRYVEGGSLATRLPALYSPLQAQGIINPLAGALDYLHQHGVVHGNLKPSNILIDEQGRPLLADLGYTQGIDVGAQENVYFSPEQAQGAFADQRTDVYALGVLLYEMLIGEAPPLGAVPSPRLKRPDLPVAVEQVILKAMAQYPEQRFHTPGEFSQALNAALTPQAAPPPQPQPTAAPPPPPPPPAREPKRGAPSWLVFLIGGLVFLCVVACVLSLVLGVGGDREGAGPVPTATTTPEAGEPAPGPRPPDGSILEGFFDMIKGIFESVARIIEGILGGGATPEPPETEPPPEEPLEQPPPAEQLPEEPADQ